MSKSNLPVTFSATSVALAHEYLMGMVCNSVLFARLGVSARHDSGRYALHLCEPCFFRTLAGLRRERIVNIMFSDVDEDLSHFGRITRDDYFNDGSGSTG
ncbi:hypothetical protein D9M70_468410 [compost metagenome]